MCGLNPLKVSFSQSFRNGRPLLGVSSISEAWSGSEEKPRGASHCIRAGGRICGGIWRQSRGFPVEVGLEGKKEPGAPGASGIPQQEVRWRRLRSGQRRLHGGGRDEC